MVKWNPAKYERVGKETKKDVVTHAPQLRDGSKGGDAWEEREGNLQVTGR